MNRVVLFCFVWSLVLFGCVSEEERPVVKCHNGRFVGMVEDNGIMVFKGIPYAKPPVGELRWKAPVALDSSNETFQANEFGLAALQAYAPSEMSSSSPKGEDCLTLNVWTKDLKTKGKPVLFWIHGGSYSYGGTLDSLYTGKYLVKGYPNVVFVSANYRLNLLGFIDFSHVPGGENFPDAPYLGILDQQAALRWVQQNIEAFGGDPQNVTIFGESAGGGSVSCHLVAKGSEGLFQHAIVMSGPIDLTHTQEMYDNLDQAGYLLKVTGCSSMNELMKLSEDDLLKAMETDTGVPGSEGLTSVAGHNNHPLRAERSIIPLNPYEALAQGASKNVDLIVGTTFDELHYWAHLFYNVVYNGDSLVYDKNTHDPLGFYYNYSLKGMVNYVKHEFFGEKPEVAEQFVKSVKERQDCMSEKYPMIWERTEMVSEMLFRMGSILMAQNHATAAGRGKTYMYFFGKPFHETSYPGESWLGACHACELTYAFNNLIYQDGAPYDPILTKNFSGAIVSFATNGNPSTKDVPWTEYDTTLRNTMVIERDGSMKMLSDPKREQREMLFPWFCNYWSEKR